MPFALTTDSAASLTLAAMLTFAAGREQPAAAQDTALVNRLTTALRSPPILAIGVLDGDPQYVLGRVTHWTVDESDNLFLLDQHSNSIRWFGEGGRFVSVAGREGSGPGEFRSFSGIALRDRELAVLDLRQSRISWYSVAAEEIQHIRDVRVEGSAYDLCWGSQHFVLSTPQDSSTIRVVDGTGTTVNRFGDPGTETDLSRIAPSMRDWVRIDANRGKLICLRDRRMIVYAHATTPRIRSFTEAGELIWTSQLSDYHRMRYVPVRGHPGSWTSGPDPESGTATTLTSFFRLSKDLAAAVIHETTFEHGTPGQFVIRVISLTTGREVARIPSRYSIVAASARRLYAYQTDPYPRILVFRIPE